MVRERYNAATIVDANLEAGRGERTALWFGAEQISYRQLFDRICAMGRALHELGAGRESRVLLLLADTPVFPVAFFGALRIGAVAVPLNPALRPADYRFLLAETAAHLVIAEASSLDKLALALEGYDEPIRLIVADQAPPSSAVGRSSPSALLREIYPLEELLAAHAGELPPVETHPQDMAFWLYSSGSTGRPKGVVHLHEDIPATCDTYARHVLRLTESDIVFGRVLFHAYGLGNSLTFPFSAGASSVLAPGRPAPPYLIETIRRYRPSVLCLVPTLYNALLNYPDSTAADLSSLRLCISAAEPLAPETWRRWKERFDQVILDGIGSTELLHIFCSNTPKELRPGSSGKPVPGYELRIVGEDGQPVAAGETGDLLVKGASAAPFYWHEREKSRQTMQGAWTVTGDRYRVDEDGFYWYEGRADDMLKIGGEWVSPIEIENALMEHEAVREAAVVGVPVDGIMRIRAVVVPVSSRAPRESLAAELQAWCKGRLLAYQYPHIVDFVDELPKTATGKVQRFQLRKGKVSDR